MDQNYVIIKQTRIKSRYGHLITQIDLVGVKDRLCYRTYIDPNNRNFTNWAHILHHSNHGFLLGRLKTRSQDIISADSNPVIRWESTDPEEIYGELLSVWQEQDSQSELTL